MSQFDGLMDDDDYSDAASDDDAPPPGSKFAGLMSDSDDDIDEPPPVQPVIAAPPPPPPPPSTKKNTKKKEQSKDDDDDEFAFLQKLAEQNKKNPESAPSVSVSKKLELNIAKELNERFFETSFDDSLKLPKNSSNNKFITKRKNWPNLIPPSFTVKEASSDNGKKGKKRNKNKSENSNSQQIYSISLSDYGQSCKKNFAILQRNLDIGIMLYKLRSDPFDFELLMGIARYHLFRKEFQEATDLVLRLTFIVQQTIPNKFISGITKFQSNTDFYDVLEFIARFAFRRGCNYTSTEIWKFAVSVVENDDPNCFYLCAAVPALFSSDLEFIENVLSRATIKNQSNENDGDDYAISFRGIPINYIPDWSVCQALLYLTEKNDDSKMTKVCALWPDIFTEMKEDDTVEITIDKEMPLQLQRLCIALKRRLKPIVMKDEVQDKVLQLSEKIKSEDVKDEKERIFKKWEAFNDDIDVSMIVEEDALPVNPFNN